MCYLFNVRYSRLIHQESLCKSNINLKHIVDPVVRAVNLIRARGLYHRKFRSFLEDIEADFSNFLSPKVYWLSMGRVLKRVSDLKEEIVIFLNIKDISCDFLEEMQSEVWVCDFAFAVDIMQKLNELNIKLRGKGAFAHELYRGIKAIQVKLKFFAKQLSKQKFAHFPHLKRQAVTQT